MAADATAHQIDCATGRSAMSSRYSSDPATSGLNRRKTMMLVAAAALAERPAVSAAATAQRAGPAAAPPPAVRAAATAQQLAQDSRIALDRLYAKRPETRAWGERAKAVLVFPEIVKAGLVVGGQGGDGALLVNNEVIGF